jgi:hypothetical protein
MKKADLISKMLDTIRQAREGNAHYRLLYESGDRNSQKHEFLFFVKPEITALEDPEYIRAVLNFALEKIDRFCLSIRDIRLLPSAYLKKYDIMARHYGVINALSRDPLSNFSTEAASKFSQQFGITVDRVKLVGSLQFLEQYPSWSADDLEKAWQQMPAVKLAGGTYCAHMEIEGNDLYLVNGFHPKQLLHFTAPGRSIVAFTLSGDLDWSDARNQFIGKTNPAEALPGSLRNEILMNKAKFGLSTVNAGQNGFHLSAGPLEGLVELIRYGSDFSSGMIKTPEDFVFGRLLSGSVNESLLDHLLKNGFVLYEGAKTSPFDLTEEKNSAEALELLQKVTIV